MLGVIFILLTTVMTFPVRAAPPPVDPRRLETHVRMLAETLAPRDAAHPENLDRVAAYLRKIFAAAGGRVSEQPYRVGRSEYRNVLARFGPETRERIVVGAHYDTAGPYPGADDNGSGVAGLLELAPLLRAAPLAVTVELAAYTLEEPPYFRSGQMGSAVHAQSLKAAGVPLRAMFALEMIGYYTDKPFSQAFPAPGLSLFYPNTGNFIAVVGRAGEGGLVRRIEKAMAGTGGVPVHSIAAPRFLPGIDFSDHASFWDRDYPAVMITDTAFYRNPHYHTRTDTPETLDYGRMAKVVESVFAAVLSLAR